jgi:hypothetical protein
VAYGSEYLCIIAAVYPGGLELRRSVIAHEMNELQRPSFSLTCNLLSSRAWSLDLLRLYQVWRMSVVERGMVAGRVDVVVTVNTDYVAVCSNVCTVLYMCYPTASIYLS